jgi:pimeloyl-ACP methyl ester carboxylesterase
VETALQLGDRVRGIVPIDSLLNVDRAQTPDARAAFFGKMRADFPGTTEKIVRSLMAKNADPKVVDRVLKDELAQDPGRGPSILEATFAYPSAQKLESVKVPIVAIDADLNPVALEANRAHAPQFDAKVMTGVGHWLMLDKPADFAKLLREVVTSIESGAAKGRG